MIILTLIVVVAALTLIDLMINPVPTTTRCWCTTRAYIIIIIVIILKGFFLSFFLFIASSESHLQTTDHLLEVTSLIGIMHQTTSLQDSHEVHQILLAIIHPI